HDPSPGKPGRQEGLAIAGTEPGTQQHESQRLAGTGQREFHRQPDLLAPEHRGAISRAARRAWRRRSQARIARGIAGLPEEPGPAADAQAVISASRVARFSMARVARDALLPASELPDRADQPSDLHGLRQVFLESLVERAGAVLAARECRERHGRQLPGVELEPPAYCLDEIVAGGPRHADVAHQKVETP